MITKIIKKIDSLPITLPYWLLGFAAIIFIRFLLENFSSTAQSGYITSDFYTLIHYYLFYFGALLSMAFVLKLFLPYNLLSLTKLMLFGFFIAWLAPIVDLLVTYGAGLQMAYIFQTPAELFHSYLTFCGPLIIPGITIGMRIEMILFMVGIFVLIYEYSHSAWKALLAALLTYTIAFIWIAAPSVVKLISDMLTLNIELGSYEVVQNFFFTTANSSLLASNLFHQTITYSTDRMNDMLFNAVISQIFIIVICILAAAWAWLYHKRTLLYILRRIPLPTMAHFLLMVFLGMLLAWALYLPSVQFNWVDILTIISTFLSFYCATMFARGLKRIYIEKIDEHPIQKKGIAVTGTVVRNYNIFFFTIAVLSALMTSHYTLFMVLTFLAAYYLYYAPPVRLRQFPFISTFLMSICSLAGMFSGFWLFSTDKQITAFPLDIILLVLVTLVLGTHMKDLKTIEDYEKKKVKELPGLYKKYGKTPIAVMAALAFLSVPLILGQGVLFLTSLPAAVASYWLIIKQQPFNYYTLFTIYIAYILCTLGILSALLF